MDIDACPFCGSPGRFQWDSGSYGYTPPTQWIECSNDKCLVKPRTPSLPTEQWAPKKGHYPVYVDDDLRRAWNTRATLTTQE
jgi:hypothetical protein